jgi:hypothetical protein
MILFIILAHKISILIAVFLREPGVAVVCNIGLALSGFWDQFQTAVTNIENI